jgi:hypothetical protein
VRECVNVRKGAVRPLDARRRAGGCLRASASPPAHACRFISIYLSIYIYIYKIHIDVYISKNI